MTASKDTADRFSPIRGWVTEGNLANYPQEVAIDIENMDIEKTGLTQRRTGLSAEDPTTSFLPNFDANAKELGMINVEAWREVSGSQDINMLVFHVGYYIHVLLDSTPLTNSSIVHTVDLRSAGIKLDGTIDGPCHLSIGVGFVIATHPKINPVLIELEDVAVDGTPTLSHRALNLQIRTRDLLGDYLNGPNRTTIDATLEWDLRNSGWPTSVLVIDNAEGSRVIAEDAIVHFEAKRGYYPSPQLLYNSMKASATTAVSGVGAFSPWEADKLNFGKTAPPLGRFTHSAYSFNSRTLLQEGLLNDPTATSYTPLASGTVTWTIKERPRCSGYHNGHVYFADRDRNGKTRILVSQLVTELDNIERCYQDADPTAEEINDLIATDGYTMTPVGMGAVLHMVEFNKRLLLLCTNGVWALSGTSGGGATATDFTLDKIATAEFDSPRSVVDTGDAVLMWTTRGIVAITVNQFGELTTSNLTLQTIDEYIDSLERDAVRNVQGVYVEGSNRIHWTIPTSRNSENVFKSDSELVLILDLNTGGFFKHTITGGPKIHAPLRRVRSVTVPVDTPVTETDGTIVTTIAGDTITTKEYIIRETEDQIAYFITHDAVSPLFSFIGVHNVEGLYDWSNVVGFGDTEYKSFVDFAYLYPPSKIGAVLAPYVHSFFLTESRSTDVTDKHSAKLSANFDWSLDSRTKKIGRQQEAFKYNTRRLAQGNNDEDDYPYEVLDTKLRIRGAGRTLFLRYESTGGKDLRLLGYALIGMALNDTEGNK